MPLFGWAVVSPKENICTGVSHDLTRYIVNCDPDNFNLVVESDKSMCCILNIIETVADWLFMILLMVAGFIILFAAFQFMTAGGAPEKVNAARDKLIWAAVGIAVAFLSKGLVRVVEMFLA